MDAVLQTCSKNYANHGHLNGKYCDSEIFPSFVRPLHDYISRNKPIGTVARQEKERIDGLTMPRQRPLVTNVMAELRSERLDVNVWNGITNIQPNQDVKFNCAFPINVDIETTTIRADGTRGGDDERQQQKRRRNHYHDTIFDSDSGDDTLRDDLSATTSAVTKMIAAQQRRMLSKQSNSILSQYKNAKQKLDNATDPDDIQFYTLAKKRVVTMMTILDANKEEE